MQVIVHDDKSWLSKTQTRKFIENIKKGGDVTEAFRSLHYPEGIEGYKGVTVIKGEQRLDVHLLVQDPDQAKRQMLKKRLQSAIRGKSHNDTDPLWKLYGDLKKRVAVPLPTPDEVADNLELYKGLAERMDPKNPITDYFERASRRRHSGP